VAACNEDYLVTVYRAATGEVYRLLPHSRGIDGLTWSNPGKTLVTGQEVTQKNDGTKEGYIRVFDMVSGDETKTIDFGNAINELFSPWSISIY
jgi:WD40 repeat protein